MSFNWCEVDYLAWASLAMFLVSEALPFINKTFDVEITPNGLFHGIYLLLTSECVKKYLNGENQEKCLDILQKVEEGIGEESDSDSSEEFKSVSSK